MDRDGTLGSQEGNPLNCTSSTNHITEPHPSVWVSGNSFPLDTAPLPPIMAGPKKKFFPIELRLIYQLAQSVGALGALPGTHSQSSSVLLPASLPQASLLLPVPLLMMDARGRGRSVPSRHSTNVRGGHGQRTE